jgi:serine phosphatase RsbU (regulator of sigma subunit)
MKDDTIEEYAAALHYSFMPTAFETTRVEAAVRVAPYDQVGGDYCSILAPDEHKLVACMCDAVGHGYPAALIAARVNTFVLTHVGRTSHPCELVTALNEFLCSHRMPRSILATFFAAYLDFESMTLEFSAAAHPPALHLHAASHVIDRLESDASFLGIHHPFTEACPVNRRTFDSGDRIVIYTDGLSEAKALGGTDHGTQRLERFLYDYTAYPASSLADAVFSELNRAGAQGKHDDALLMVIAIK